MNGTVEISFTGDREIELDEVDVGVSEDVLAFDVSGRISGLDKEKLDRLAGKRLTPIRLELQIEEDQSNNTG